MDLCNIDNYIVKNYYFLDFLHTPSSFPTTNKASTSFLGIIISLLYLLYTCYYIIGEINNYKTNYRITNSQVLQDTSGFINHNLTFGFKIEDTYYDSISMNFYDSRNNPVNANLIKKCDENLKEIKEIKDNKKYYTCLFDYPVSGSDITNHFLKIELNTSIRTNSSQKAILMAIIKEPTINHDSENPFIFKGNNGLTELKFIFDLNREISYRKYFRIIEYNSFSFFNSTIQHNEVALEEFEDSSMFKINEQSVDSCLGRLRLSLSSKKEIFVRKYPSWKQFLSDIGGHLSAVKNILSIVVLILVNPNDNLRIFNTIRNIKPYLREQSSNLIEDYWKKQNIDKQILGTTITNNINNIDKWYNLFSFCFCACCCNKKSMKKKYSLLAINNYIKDRLTIDNYIENIITDDSKDKKIQKN